MTTETTIQETNAPNLNGARVRRVGGTIFIALPRELWKPIDLCNCSWCAEGKSIPAWDTLAVAASKPGNRDYAWTVHAPEFAQL